MYSLFSMLTCLIFSFRQRWPMNFTWRHYDVCVVCGALIFRNGHEVSSRVGDMSRTFNHLFVVINMPTQISQILLVKRGARDTFFHHEDTVDVDTSFQQCENTPTLSNQETGKRRGKELDVKGSSKVYRNVGHKQIYIILFNNLNLTTLASIKHNLSKCLYCISK